MFEVLLTRIFFAHALGFTSLHGDFDRHVRSDVGASSYTCARSAGRSDLQVDGKERLLLGFPWRCRLLSLDLLPSPQFDMLRMIVTFVVRSLVFSGVSFASRSPLPSHHREALRADLAGAAIGLPGVIARCIARWGRRVWAGEPCGTGAFPSCGERRQSLSSSTATFALPRPDGVYFRE